ncbi:MAG: ABC transporter permease [Candidatus Acidiferrales bacterium]
MGELVQDLRYGFRVLRKSPGFAAAAVIVLALGIGANTAIFSVVNAVLLRPLPLQDPERLVVVWHVPPAKSFPGITRFSVSPANYLDWQRQNRVFEQLAAFQDPSLNLTGKAQPEAVTVGTVTGEFFSVLRAGPILGHVFGSDEDQPGHNKVVVLSNAFWQSHFGSNTNALGQKLTLGDEIYTVIGVMPPKFRFPPRAQLWIPLGWTDKERAVRGEHNYEVTARLKPGVALQQAQAEMDTISSRLHQQYPVDDAGWGAVVVPFREQLVGDVRPALLVLLGAVAFVLLIACANVANLTLAKIFGRQKEIAIRTVLGASRGRVLRQVLSESLLLSLAGGALGLVLAQWGVSAIVANFSDELPRFSEIGVDSGVLGFTLVISMLTGIIAGLAPAWRLTKTNLNEAMKQGLGKTDSDSGGNRMRSALVVSEVALSLVLLIGAGLMIRSLWMLRSVNPGFDPRNVLTMELAIPEAKYPKPYQQAGFYKQVVERVRALPGVESAGTVSSLPLMGGSTQPFLIEGQPVLPMADQPEVAVREISPGYLRSMRIPLLQGRELSDADTTEKPAVVLVSQSFAKRFWPHENPIGKRLTLTFSPERPREVVGVVGDVKQDGLDRVQPRETIYNATPQIPQTFMTLVVRTNSPPNSLVSAVTNAVHQVDPDEPVLDVQTMEDVVNDSLFQQRFSMLLLAAFAGLALLLAAVGIYSVLAYAVRRRVREIGIRMALGAQMSDVLRMIVAEGMRPVLIGVAIGLAGAVALGRVVASLIYGVKPSDPGTFAAVSALLAAVAFAASVVPAYRATRVDPMKALREE